MGPRNSFSISGNSGTALTGRVYSDGKSALGFAKANRNYKKTDTFFPPPRFKSYSKLNLLQAQRRSDWPFPPLPVMSWGMTSSPLHCGASGLVTGHHRY